jgi:hypothetical protein
MAWSSALQAAKQFMSVNVIGIDFEQIARGSFRFMHVAGTEVKVSQSVIQLRRVGIGIEGILVLVHSQPGGIGIAILQRFVFIDIGQC